jgi:hypothetical protein
MRQHPFGVVRMSSPAVSSQRRVALWNAMLDADLNVCYWSFLSDKYSRIDKTCRVIVAVSASTTVAAWGFWADFPILWKILSGLACLTSVITPIVWPADQVRRMNGLIGSWKQIAKDYELLWDRDDELLTSGTWESFKKAKEQQSKIDETSLPFSDKLRRKAQQAVRQKRGI